MSIARKRCYKSKRLTEKNGELYVIALNEPQQHVPDIYRFALDETPILPDAPVLNAYTANKGVPLSCDRTSVWTLLPVLRGDGTVLSCLLL